MKINQKITDALNEQINKELWSGYIYLSMSTQFEEDNFGGFASWMRAQANEELEHAMKLFDYVISRGGRVLLKAIPEVPTQWASPLAAFEEAYNHEMKATKMIEDLVDLARTESDKATEIFLQWFINEQVEEEETSSEIVAQLQMIGDNMNGLFMLNGRLGKRKAD
jgi:ferritin